MNHNKRQKPLQISSAVASEGDSEDQNKQTVIKCSKRVNDRNVEIKVCKLTMCVETPFVHNHHRKRNCNPISPAQSETNNTFILQHFFRLVRLHLQCGQHHLVTVGFYQESAVNCRAAAEWQAAMATVRCSCLERRCCVIVLTVDTKVRLLTPRISVSSGQQQ